MKVFLSWSGETSKLLALKLREWLPSVIQCLQPWASSFDIEAGSRWSRDIEEELKDTKFGILCLTRTNLHADWILFEAGALAKTINDSFVVPYLFGLTPTQIPSGPLSQFQAKKAVREETWQLIQTINRALSDDKKLQDTVLRRAFDVFWPELEQFLSELPEEESLPEQARSTNDMVEEILESVRYLRRQHEGNQTENILENYFKHIAISEERKINKQSDFDLVAKSPDGKFLYIIEAKSNSKNSDKKKNKDE